MPTVLDSPSLRFDRQLAIAFGALAAVMLSVLGLIAVAATASSNEREQAEFVDTIAATLAGSAAEVGFSGKWHTRQLFQRLHEENDAIVFLSLVGPDGVVLASHDPARDGTVATGDGLAEAMSTLQTGERGLQRRWEAGEHLTEVDVPIRGGFENHLLGVLRVGVRTRSWGQTLWDAAWVIVIAIGVLVASAVPVLGILARRFAAPVQRQARQLLALMEHTPLFIAVSDADGREVLVSRHLEDVRGRSAANETAFRDLLDGDPEGVGPALEEVAIDGEAHALLSLRFPVGSSQRCWIGSDTTALSEASAQRDRFASVVAASPDVVALFGLDGQVQHVNNAFHELLGFRPTELDAIDLWGVMVDGEGGLRGEVEACLERGEVWRGVLRLAHRDGSRGPFQVVVASVAGGGALVARDIREELEQRGRARQSEKLEAIGRAVGGVAHDVNNLLTVILSAAEMLLEADSLDSVGRDAEVVLDAAERARVLTSQLLTFTGRGERSLSTVDLREVLLGCEGMLRRLTPERIALTIDADEGLWPVWADAGQLQQVVTNLCVNARDAIEGDGCIEVRARNVHTDEGDQVELTVRDDGVGVSPAVADRMFEPFFTTKEHGKGTGLGLSIVHACVEGVGGVLSVDSTPGLGTSMVVRLPRAGAPIREVAPSASTGAVAGGDVLVVDDKPEVREAVARSLRSLGYSVCTAGGGPQALDMLGGDHGIQVVLTDLAMPGMTGVQLADLIEARHPEVGLVFMSGYRGQFTSMGWEPGARPVIDKPATAERMHGALQQVLGPRAHGSST